MNAGILEALGKQKFLGLIQSIKNMEFLMEMIDQVLKHNLIVFNK